MKLFRELGRDSSESLFVETPSSRCRWAAGKELSLELREFRGASWNPGLHLIARTDQDQ